jgi:hypothetical protein
MLPGVWMASELTDTSAVGTIHRPGRGHLEWWRSVFFALALLRYTNDDHKFCGEVI